MAKSRTLNALSGGDNEYILNSDWAGCWIGVDGAWVYIARNQGRVQVEIQHANGEMTAVAGMPQNDDLWCTCGSEIGVLAT